MNKALPEVITDILTYNGAIAEQAGDGVLDIILTGNLSESLSIPEYSRLYFSHEAQSDDGIYASYDSEVFGSMAKLFAVKGRYSAAKYAASFQPNMEKLTKSVSEKITFSNATFRIDKTEHRNIPYLLVYFKYTALSDEKHEGVMPVLVNGLNLSVSPFDNDISEFIHMLKESEPVTVSDTGRSEMMRVFSAAYSAGTRITEERLKDFVKSLERRLNRDTRRVYEYYDTLKRETEVAIWKKKRTGSQTEDKTIKGDGVERLRTKLDAIESERKWKIQDLISRYALSIQTEPVSAIRIETPSLVFLINIKRRLALRQFPVTYNPLTRHLDPLPCESCFHPKGAFFICDDRLHIICAACFSTCPDCSKQYCHACSSACPKCRKAKKESPNSG